MIRKGIIWMLNDKNCYRHHHRQQSKRKIDSIIIRIIIRIIFTDMGTISIIIIE